MCEFRVFLGGEMVMEDVVRAREDGGGVTLGDIVGEERRFEGVRIVEVDVPAARLTLGRF